MLAKFTNTVFKEEENSHHSHDVYEFFFCFPYLDKMINGIVFLFLFVEDEQNFSFFFVLTVFVSIEN